MALPAIAKKDFRDSIRSFSLVSTTLLFVGFTTWLTAIQWIPVMYQDAAADANTLALLNSMRQPTVFLVPLIGLSLSYDAIVGEVESGSIRFTLGLPNSRADVVFGKFLGRTAVIGVSILVGYSVAGIVAVVTYDSFNVVAFGLYTLLTVYYGAVYVALATGFSAGADSRSRAFLGAGALYALFLLGWDVLLLLLQLIIYGQEIPSGGLPDWFKFLGTLNPSTAFMKAARALIPEYSQITFYPEGTAFYLDDRIGFAILFVWGALPLVLGYLRFEAVDIE